MLSADESNMHRHLRGHQLARFKKNVSISKSNSMKIKINNYMCIISWNLLKFIILCVFKRITKLNYMKFSYPKMVFLIWDVYLSFGN